MAASMLRLRHAGLSPLDLSVSGSVHNTGWVYQAVVSCMVGDACSMALWFFTSCGCYSCCRFLSALLCLLLPQVILVQLHQHPQSPTAPSHAPTAVLRVVAPALWNVTPATHRQFPPSPVIEATSQRLHASVSCWPGDLVASLLRHTGLPPLDRSVSVSVVNTPHTGWLRQAVATTALHSSDMRTAGLQL
jgi:hypothetical protein